MASIPRKNLSPGVLAELERIRQRRGQASAELSDALRSIAEREPNESVVTQLAAALEALDRAGLELGINPTRYAYLCREWLRELENARRNRDQLRAELDTLKEGS